MFLQIVLLSILLILNIQSIQAFEFNFNILDYFNFNNDDNININLIKKSILEKMNENIKKENESKKSKTAEKEKKLKNQLTNLISENLNKVILLEQENKNYIKYFNLIKEKNKKENEINEVEKLIMQVENILASELELN